MKGHWSKISILSSVCALSVYSFYTQAGEVEDAQKELGKAYGNYYRAVKEAKKRGEKIDRREYRKKYLSEANKNLHEATNRATRKNLGFGEKRVIKGNKKNFESIAKKKIPDGKGEAKTEKSGVSAVPRNYRRRPAGASAGNPIPEVLGPDEIVFGATDNSSEQNQLSVGLDDVAPIYQEGADGQLIPGEVDYTKK